jgi:predicted nucleotidyltransferase
MRVVGIISEYNPFHKGHEYHISESRKRAGADSAVVCVMGGNFMQRGEPAVFSKQTRAEAAALCGADLVFELPLPWALSSAEGFARGGVGLLGALGVVTDLSFGSEAGEVGPLNALAAALLDPAMDWKIKSELEKGLPYAEARQNALEQDVGEMARLLEKPNNILAVEYLKAMFDLRIEFEPMTVKREGAGHDKVGSGEIRSASEIRQMLCEGADISRFVPEGAAELYYRDMKQGRGPVGPENLETAILSRLRMLGADDYNALPDATEGLGNKLFKAASVEPTVDAILGAAKSKRYALSRLRRMAMCAATGMKAGMAEGTPPYARLLAATEKGKGLLREITDKAMIPVITKPASVGGMSREIQDLFNLESEATDLYVLGFEAREERRGGRDYRISPAIV